MFLVLSQNVKHQGVKEGICCVGVPGIQPSEHTGGHGQHGCHCKAVGCGKWGGGGHTDCELSVLYDLLILHFSRIFSDAFVVKVVVTKNLMLFFAFGGSVFTIQHNGK
ncbi:hypothetical protein XENOCAPTIV_030290 [Xenoophorus captivus]|uniref:Uncharacterized protein n=1 Tax=Xenoophorus captivus TaxID=1517983 RepID=A0ABV0QXB5_9TELE